MKDRRLLIATTPAIKGGDQSPFAVYDLVHTCTECRATMTEPDPEFTPLQFAFQMLSVANYNEQLSLITVKVPDELSMYDGETWTQRGWAAGLDGGVTALKTPFEPALVGDTGAVRAYLVGHSAGMYASLNGWEGIDCRYVNQDEHLDHFGRFIRAVERVGKFPHDSLIDNPVARATLQAIFDSKEEVNVEQAAKVIGQAVLMGFISVRTGASLNPTVDSRNLDEAYRRYIEKIDTTNPGWFWADMRFACGEVRRAALQRISEVMA